jgi:hypothetical protein
MPTRSTGKRAGKTVKLSVSLDAAEVDALRSHAREAFDGNVSAALADALRWARQRRARARLIDELGGPSLTPDEARRIDLEQGNEGARRVGTKRKRVA